MRRFAVAVAVAFVAAAAQAATLYVAPGGSDSNAGTIDRPFATITKAASLARAGDTVHARGGVYAEVVKIASKGTSTARVTFRSYPGELAIVDGSGTASGTNLVQLNGTEWVDFAGFEVRNATRIGICAWGAKNTRILDNAIHDSAKGGIFAGYSTSGSSLNLTIAGNRVFHNVLENQYHATSGGWSQAVGIQRTAGARLTGNTIYENDGEGIGIVLSDGATVAQNEIYDNFSVELYLDNAQTTTVDGNFVYSTGNSRYYRNGLPAHGIGMANESYADTNPLSDNVIANNIVLRSRWGIFYGNYENGGGLRNTTIANNTVYEATNALLAIDSAAHANSFVENNVFHQVSGMALSSVAGGGVTYRNNNWYGGSAGGAAGASDVYGDPHLVNAGGRTAADYQLTSASPAIDAGVTVAGVPRDYFGQSRSGTYDIGAHELGSASAVTPVDATPPWKPKKRAASSGR